MRQILSLLLILTLMLALTIPALADDPVSQEPLPYTDVDGHWALPYIEQVTVSGLMIGDSETTFSPDMGMTRAMFVTALGRFAGINPDAWKMNYGAGVLFLDVESDRYYSPYLNWAARNGITLGVGHYKFEPDTWITREQMMVMLTRFAEVTGKTLQASDVVGVEEGNSFTDEVDIAGWAVEAVDEMRTCGVIQGFSNDDSTYRFAPKDTATRAQAAVVFCRMLDIVEPIPGWTENNVTLVNLNQTSATLKQGESVTLKAQLFPSDATNKTITWISSDPKVATVDKGVVTWKGSGSCTIWAYSANGCKARCSCVCTRP